MDAIEKMMADANGTVNVIDSLTKSGMKVERVGDDAYNVISTATGAVLERLITAVGLAQYKRCIDYVAKQHGKDISERYRYTRSVHSV